jgi:hypothetical protein
MPAIFNSVEIFARPRIRDINRERSLGEKKSFIRKLHRVVVSIAIG